MKVLNDYNEDEKNFFTSIGLLVSREVTAEKAAEIAGYSFNTYMELLKKKKIHPYIYNTQDYEKEIEAINSGTFG